MGIEFSSAKFSVALFILARIVLCFPTPPISLCLFWRLSGKGSVPGRGRSPAELHYSHLENPMDREAW